MDPLSPIEQYQRDVGRCEARVNRSRGHGGVCRYRATMRRVSAVTLDAGKRICRTHAQSYLPESLVRIGTEGWEDA